MSEDTLEQVFARCQENQQRDLADLFLLLSQPSISATGDGVADCAELVERYLRQAGLTTTRLATSGHPMIFAESKPKPGQPTVLIYGHYDVQPPGDESDWVSPPFEPTIREGRIFARGAGDNKGQFFAQISALRAWMETAGELPVNVKFIVEGEEEQGSPHIGRVVRNNADLLRADLVYTSDGPVEDDRYPCIVFGVRGVLTVELRARGANSDLHSGNFGGAVPNPVWTLIHLLASMFSPDYDLIFDGALDGVRPPSAAARWAAEALPFDHEATMRSIGIDRMPGRADRTWYERLMFWPSMTINGFTAGYSGSGSKTVLPSYATAKFDIRLVPDQRSDDLLLRIREHVERVSPGIEVIAMGAMEPSSTEVDHPLAAPVRRAVARGFGAEPVDVPLLGGSLPDALWTKDLGLPSFLVPYANSDERNHAPNENIEVERFFAGIRTCAALLAELALMADAPER